MKAFVLLSLFSLPWMNGPTQNAVYEAEPGKVYVYEAYFNNCPYCHKNAPLIEGVHAGYLNNEHVVFLDVGRDCRDSDYRSWIRRHAPDHPVVKDCNGRELIQLLGVSAYQTTVIHDCQGKEVFRNVGTLNERSARAMENAIDEAILSCN